MKLTKKILGTTKKPRVIVFRSNKGVTASFIDDAKNITIFSATSLKIKEGKTKTEKAKALGLNLGSVAKGKKITEIVFDRNRYIYHGQVKALAEGLRESGLKF